MIYISTVAGGRGETNRTGQSSNILLSPSNQMVVTTQQVWSKYFILDKKKHHRFNSVGSRTLAKCAVQRGLGPSPT